MFWLPYYLFMNEVYRGAPRLGGSVVFQTKGVVFMQGGQKTRTLKRCGFSSYSLLVQLSYDVQRAAFFKPLNLEFIIGVVNRK